MQNHTDHNNYSAAIKRSLDHSRNSLIQLTSAQQAHKNAQD